MNPPWGDGDVLFWKFLTYALKTYRVGGENCKLLFAFPSRLQVEVDKFLRINGEDLPYSLDQVVYTGR